MLDIAPSPTPLERKIFNLHFDNFLTTGMINPEIIELMDSYQIFAVNEVKKSFARIKSKETGFIPEDKYTK